MGFTALVAGPGLFSLKNATKFVVSIFVFSMGINKKNIKSSIFFLLYFLIVCIFISCEKDIDIQLQAPEKKLVVEATIENGQPPVVFLSTSLSFFSKISPELLAQSIVQDADVFMSNGTLTHKLKRYSLPVVAGINLSYYSIDSADLATAFVGKLNTSYSLKINWQGNEYTAGTTIPFLTRNIDSLWFVPPVNPDSTEVTVIVRATDPPGFGDYIRYFTKRNREPFFPGFNSVYDDLFIDGTTYELPVERGIDRNSLTTNRNLSFHRGDTVVLKVSNINKATYDFWRTMEFSYQSVGNPFSTPVKVLGNISNGALGYFGGYASQYRTLIIPQ